MKVLVIDDEKPTLSMFKLFLEAYGYDVHTAENGEIGLELFKKISPGIIFTDIKMPGIDGLEVLRRIRKEDTAAQVIIITGHGDMEKALEALDMDASDFITKPVERAALNSALLRAEKRMHLPAKEPFKIEESAISESDTTLKLSFSGRMAGLTKEVFTSLLEKGSMPDIEKINITLDDSFSIDRSGISLLMSTLQKLHQKKEQVTIDNLSYNYARVFQMVGIDKMAKLIETLPEE